MPLAGHGLRPAVLRRRASRPQLKRDPLGGYEQHRFLTNALDPYLLALIAWAAFEGLGTVYVRKAASVDEKRRRFRLHTHASCGLFPIVIALGFAPLFALLTVPGVAAIDRLIVRRTRFCDRVGHTVIEVPWRPPILRCPQCGAPVH